METMLMVDTGVDEQQRAGTRSEMTVGPDDPSSEPQQPPTNAGASITAADQDLLPTVAGEGTPRRTVKLVLTLQPANSQGYRALLAMGADGCDPVLRAADVADFTAALDEMSRFIVEAEARWQVQPRYPATASAPKGKRFASAGRTVEGSQALPGEAQELATEPLAATAPELMSADAGQLSLFPERQ
jgi:hypothetical protein